jgi:hypothetical protein
MPESNGFTNVATKIEKDSKGKAKKLIIEIDLTIEGEASKTGKSMVVASTHGNQPVPDLTGGYKLGVNFYKPA